MAWICSRNSGQRPVAGSCDYGNYPSFYIKGGEFLEYLNNFKLLKKKTAP
jgi:hypothetical protein